MKRRWGVVHYCFGRRDGVSLEIDKRLKLFRQLGVDFVLIGGNRHPRYRRESIYFPGLDLSRRENIAWRNLAQLTASASWRRRYQLSFQTQLKAWQALLAQLKLDLLWVHNLFSLPLILPTAIALLTALRRQHQPTVAVHHDFSWQRAYLQSSQAYWQQKLASLPPRAKFIRHQVINSRDQELLWQRRRLRARRIGDYWDFSQQLPRPNFPFYRHFAINPERELVLLQATRILPRKGIENSLRFAAVFNRLLRSYQRRALIFFSNFVVAGAEAYARRLRQLGRQLGLRLLWAGNQFALTRQRLSFWLPYHFADLVLYPSLEEGFGNQFLEAVAFRRPLVLFEYPVFRRDLKPEGYHYISLGSYTYRRQGLQFVPQPRLLKAARQALTWWRQPRPDWLEINYRHARRYHDLANLRRLLRQYL